MSAILRDIDAALASDSFEKKNAVLELAGVFIELLQNKRDVLEKQNKQLKRYKQELEALRDCGVDNWEGYSEAMQLLEEEEGEANE